jgi:DNA-binding CsgD family transcriptional regulator
MSSRFSCTFSGFTRWSHAEHSDISFSAGTDPAHITAYHDHWGRVNPWVLEGGHKLTDGSVLPTEALVPVDRFVRSEFFNDFLNRERIGRHGLAAQISSGREILHLSLVRQDRRGPFHRTELSQVERLVPFVRQAIAADRVAAELRAQCAAISDALDMLPYAVFVFGPKLVTNGEARRMLSAWPSVFSANRHTLRIANPSADAALQRRIAQARTPAAAVDAPFLIRLSSDARVQISVLAGFNGATWAHGRPPIVVMRECLPPRLLSEQLVRRYGLTPREASLVNELQAHHSMRAAAERLGISFATARTHLARVFRKIGVHSQRDLLALTRHRSAGE